MTLQTWDVLVIGAGMAGLAAAHDLRQAGKNVLVLEARERIGGRIWTDREFTTVPIELGAELIHGINAETWHLARGQGLRTVELTNSQTRSEDGQWVSVQTLMDESIDADDLPMPRPTESAADYLARLGIQREDYPVEVLLAELDSESATRLSALELFNRLTEIDETADDHLHDYRVIGGYDQMFTPLADGLDIRLGQVVTHIDWKGTPVQVTTHDGTVFSATSVIVTLPLGVLKARRVRFTPDLPVRKWAAVDQLGICEIVKVHVVFDEPVLDAGVGGVLDLSNTPPPYWWNASQGYDDFSGQVLVGWAVGDHARRLIAMPESEAIAAALDGLRATLDRPDLVPSAARLINWADEPMTGGAYTYIPPGATEAPRILAEPVGGRLYFAGEATHRWYGYVAGAYLSGRRAASEVLHDQA